jgi:hypothetical protein
LALGPRPSGELVAAAHEAAAPSIAPDVGTATVVVESDAAGFVTTARVVSATPDLASWGDFARELTRLTSSKKLRVPPGARGVRTRLRVVAEWTMPGGQHVETSAGAVPDDVPGADKVCEYSGPQRRCTAGMPVGHTYNGFDLTNIGAKPLRIVRVKVEGETFL